MKKVLFLVFLFGIFNHASLLFGTDVLLKNGDFNIWNYENFKAYINKNWWIYTETNFRFDRNGSHLYYFHDHIQMTWKPYSFLTIAPAYRQIFVIPGEGELILTSFHDVNDWIPVYYPNLNIAFLYDTTYLHFRDRSRVAYEILPKRFFSFNAWIYRNKFTIRTRHKYSLLKLRFLVDGEIFIRERRGLDEYRLTTRIDMKFIPKIRLELGYRFVGFEEVDTWLSKNVLLIKLNGKF